MHQRWLGALVALVFVLGTGLATSALAQTTGDIEGTVADQNGSALPGVSVEIKSSSLLGTRLSVSDGSGRFRFPAVPPGSYTVVASLSGFTKVEKSARVTLGATVSLPLVLSVSVKEEVVVTGEAPAVDVTKTTVGATASIDQIQKLPLARNFVSIANTVAGTGTDVSGNVTVYGATGLENAYIIDGVNTTGVKTGTQTKTLNNEFVQEVEVKTGGYEAEYGRVLGGTINVITKSGGNEFHGDGFGYYDSSSLASSDSNVADRGAVNQPKYYSPKRLDFGLDLGGYFVKDRLWFFGAYDRVNLDQNYQRTIAVTRADLPKDRTAVFGPVGTESTRNNLFSGKLTFRLGESNTIAATVFGDPGSFDGRLNTTGIGADSAFLISDKRGGTDVALKYDGVFGTMLLVQAQYGYHEEKREQSSPYAGNVYREFNQQGVILNGRRQPSYLAEAYPDSGPLILYNEKYRRNVYRASGTIFAGTNEVKVGLDWEHLNSSFNERYGGTDRLTVRLNAAGGLRNVQHRYFAVTPISANCAKLNDPTRPFSIQNCAGYNIAATVDNPPTTDNIGFFAQDSWKVLNNLTVNAGIRYENQKLKDYTGATLIDIKNEWSPRIGVIWDFLKNGKSKLYANYGRFYEVIPQDIQTRALGNEYTMFVRNRTTDKADPINTVFPYAYVQGGEVVQDGLKGMYQDEIIGGVEYEVMPNWAIGVKGIYRALGRAVEDRCDLAVNPDMASYFQAGGGVATCALINLGEGNSLGTIKDPFDKKCYPNGDVDANDNPVASQPCDSTLARRYFRGVEVTATHRFASNFYMLASYLYSKLEGNYSGNLSQTRETGQSDPNINADFDYPGLVPNTFGTLRNDRTHQFKVSGYYAFPFGVSAGLNFHIESGRPYSVRGCALDTIACNGGYSQEGYLLPRGSAGRLPSTYEADLHLEYQVRLGGVSVTPIIDVFNLLDRQGVTSVEELYNQTGDRSLNAPCADGTYSASCALNPNFGKAIAWQTPRVVRLGARVSF